MELELVAVFVVGEAEFVDGALRVDCVSGGCEFDAVAVGIVDEEVALTVGSVAGSVSDLNSGGFDGFECGVQVIDLKSDVPTGWCSISRLDEVQHAAIFSAGPDQRIAFDLVGDYLESDQVAEKADRRGTVVGRKSDVVDFFDFEAGHFMHHP